MFTRFKQKRVYSKTSEEYKKEYKLDSPVFGVLKGMQSSVPPMLLSPDKNSYMHNCMYLNGKTRTRFGYSILGSGLPLPSPIVTLKEFSEYDGTSTLICFTTTDVYKYNASTKYWDLLTPNVLITDTSSNWTASANVTSEVDSTWYRYGSKSIKLTIAAGFATGLAGYLNITSIDLTTYDHLHFYVKSNIACAAGAIKLLLDDTNGCASPIETIDLPALEAGIAKEINIAIATPASCSAITSVGLNIATDNGAQIINISDIRATKQLTGAVYDKFNCDKIYDSATSTLFFVASNAVDNMLYYTGTNNFAELGGTPDKAKFLKNFYNYLITLNCESGGNVYPQKINWCVNTKPTDWTSAGSGNNSLGASTGAIMGAEIIQSQLAILLEHSIAMQYIVGTVYASTQTPIPFEFDEYKIEKTGCSCSGSVQSLGASIIFLGWDNIYEFDGYSCNPIGDDIFKDFISSINPSQTKLIHSHIIKKYNLYLIFVPSLGSTETDTCWVYDYKEKVFLGVWEFATNFTCCGSFKISSSIIIGDLINSIGSYSVKIGSFQGGNSFSDIDVFGDSDGYVYQMSQTYTSDNGVAINSYIDTKSYIDMVAKWIRVPSVFVFGVGTDINVLVSKDDGETFVNKDTITLSDDFETPCASHKIDTTTRSIMFRFQNNTLDGWFDISGWMYRYIKKEKTV